MICYKYLSRSNTGMRYTVTNSIVSYILCIEINIATYEHLCNVMTLLGDR